MSLLPPPRPTGPDRAALVAVVVLVLAAVILGALL